MIVDSMHYNENYIIQMKQLFKPNLQSTRIVSADFGTEFKKGLDEALAGLTSRLESTSPYVKWTTSQAENSLRLLKRALTKLCLYKP